MPRKILILDKSGMPLQWIEWEDAITAYAKNQVVWEAGTMPTIARGGNNRISGKQSIITAAPIISTKGIASGKKKYKIPPLNNRELFRRDQHTCAYCAKRQIQQKLTRDHIVPTSRGGKDTWMNCVTCCSRCNSIKSDYLLEECNMKLLYQPYTPTREEYLVLTNPNITNEQLEFLLGFIPEYSRLHKKNQLGA
jgi:hypothetical protein